MATPIQASAAALDTAIATLHDAVRTYIEAADAIHANYKRQHPGRSYPLFDQTTDRVLHLLLADELLAQIVGLNQTPPIASLATIHA